MKETRVHEVSFCARVKSWAEALFARKPALRFKRVEIEESTAKSRKRSDLRVYDAKGNLRLAGEVKLPGTPDGRNAFAFPLINDSATKASNAGAEFFFTWNVNQFVLFDAKLWQKPSSERQVKTFDLGLNLADRQDVERPEVEARIKQFLDEFFTELAEIISGAKKEWATPLDEFFIRAFESHIDWPVKLSATHLHERAEADKSFDARLQEWMSREQGWQVLRQDVREWRLLLDRAARTLCYVFANRLLFYESVRARFTELEKLAVPKGVNGAKPLYTHFQKIFQAAVEATGDYETLFYPLEDEEDWAGALIFGHADAIDAWRSVIGNLQPFDFQNLRSDILGDIFKRLIAPEERHKFGQHYTSEDLVDVVNAFCLRRSSDTVLDPACGSGSFLVRAYHRKAWLDHSRQHEDLLREIFGADIALFAAHLATLNLASRDIKLDENYPRIRRGNFFHVIKAAHATGVFCRLPRGLKEDDGKRELQDIPLPPLNAIVGNPPYVRQELVPKLEKGKNQPPMTTKEELAGFIGTLWPGVKFSKRSDLHCYFWPASTWRLKEGGWFGFLVSSSWLDVDYGFDLQAWVLQNFRIHAILESNAEPWFEDARVKTCAVLLQRCEDAVERHAQLVKFVRLDQPLSDILGERGSEAARQHAAEKFRDLISRCKEDTVEPGLRIIVKAQHELWEEGLRAGKLFEEQRQRNLADGVKPPADEDSEVSDEDTERNGSFDENGNGYLHEDPLAYGSRYGGGKWGKYLRAPNLYFEVMRKYGSRFARLGEITTIRFGVKSGCDAFFMPWDVSADFLQRYDKQHWHDAPLHTHCKRSEVESGAVRLILAGDETVHPVEATFLAPEVHSLMNVSRPVIRAAEIDRFILLVSKPLDELKGTHVAKYLRYGEKATFASNKSKAVPVAKRSTCAGRTLWYDLTYTKPGAFFWPMAQQYRHVIPSNPENLICNHNLFDVHPFNLFPEQVDLLRAVVNSTIVANFKTFYGRYAGTEGNLKTEVVDVNLLELPDPRHATPAVATKLKDAFAQLCQRDTSELVEEEFKECHSAERVKKLAGKPICLPWELQQSDRRALDLAVFELIGVSDAAERERLCDELYRETAAHFRQIRIVEIQKQEQRGGAEGREFRTDELAADLWDALAEDEREPLPAWLARNITQGLTVTIPDGTPALPEASDMFSANTVFFRQNSGTHQLALPSRAHAELLYCLCHESFHGDLDLPASESDAASLLARLSDRLAVLTEKARQLAASRTSDDSRIDDLAGLLCQWMLHGKPQRKVKRAKAVKPTKAETTKD